MLESTGSPDRGHGPQTMESLPQRIRDFATLRGLGYSLREIGGQFDVTPQAVSLALLRHRRSLISLAGALELSPLSSRAINALGRHGVTSRQKAKERRVLTLLQNERNCGRKTLAEIKRWLDADGTSATLAA